MVFLNNDKLLKSTTDGADYSI